MTREEKLENAMRELLAQTDPWRNGRDSDKELNARALAVTAIALPREQGDDGWRIMDSAPSDTFVLICNPKMGDGLLVARRVSGKWYLQHGGLLGVLPTHWRHLPVLPAASGDAAGDA